MTEHKMRVIDGIRYRPEDVPERRGPGGDAAPLSTESAKGRRKRKGGDGDGGSPERSGPGTAGGPGGTG